MKTMAAQVKNGHPPLCLFVLINLIRGLHGLSIDYDQTVTASPGDNITLKCILRGGKGTTIVQIQWSNVNSNDSGAFIVANHRYGSYRTMEAVEFESKSPTNGTGNIHFTNVKVSASGTYVCTFITFPTGNLKALTILTVLKEANSQNDVSPVVFEAMLNSTMLLPCGFNIPARQITSLVWFRNSNGAVEKLTQSNSLGSEIDVSSQYQGRIQLGKNYSLEIDPVLAVDDGDFICQVETSNDQRTNVTTKVNVFAEPTTPEIHEELNYFSLTKLHLNATCILQKAYPEPNITFYFDGLPLRDGDNESVIESEILLDSNGLYKVKKRLSLETEANHWRFFWCEAVFSLPRNESRRMQSKMIPLNNYLSRIEFTPEGPYNVVLKDSLNISCHANSSVIPLYKWTKVNGTVSSSNPLILKKITEQTAGIYICDVTVPGTNLHHSSYINVTIKGNESYASTELTTMMQLSNATASTAISKNSTNTELFTNAGLSTTTQSSQTPAVFGSSTSIAVTSSSNHGPSTTIGLSTSEKQFTSIQSSISFGLTNGTESSVEAFNNTILYTAGNYDNRTNHIYINTDDKESEGTVSVAVVITVIVILMICTALLSYLIKCWQVRKKLNEPPPFKPPPPPIKYTAIQVSPQDEVN
ncbi:T-cell surface protein tactile [Stegostoma tigrinum]|uniref:T-cell surface protein tactile n=1 Tax=Stegostoma tigrinum TaxID=3053191 RepID=UPI00202B6E06|nr:T-cell surface protein tactile [Stegostoma tigrinum]